MRQYVWYSQEFNIFVIQAIMEDCYIAFEWDAFDVYELFKRGHQVYGEGAIDPMTCTSWIPMGEL